MYFTLFSFRVRINGFNAARESTVLGITQVNLIFLLLYNQGCGSVSGRIRIYLGTWIRIHRYELRERQSLTNKYLGVFSHEIIFFDYEA